MGASLPYPRAKLRALLKTWASEPLPSPDSTHTPPPSNKPRSLGPTVDPIAFVAYTVFMRKLALQVVQDHGNSSAGSKSAGGAAGAKAGLRGVLDVVGAKRKKGRRVKVGRREIQRAKREVMGLIVKR